MSNEVTILRASIDLQTRFIRLLNGNPDLDNVLAEIAETTTGTLQADACTIFTVDPDGLTATQRAGTGYQSGFNGLHDIRVVPAREVKEQPEEHEKLGLTGWILSTAKPLLARSPEEVVDHPHHGRRQQIEGEEIRLRSFLGVPIRGFQGKIIGAVKAERRVREIESTSEEAGAVFSVDDELAMETIARVASRSIVYLQMAQQGLAAAALTSWARDVITEAAGSEVELDSFLDIVVRVTAAAMNADSCGIFLIDKSGNTKTLTQRAGIGSQALRALIRSYPWPEPGIILGCADVAHCVPPRCPRHCQRDREQRAGLTAWIAATGKSFHARNYEELSAHCHHKGDYDNPNFRDEEVCGAFLGVPLQIGGTIYGVVKVENISRRDQQDDRDFSLDAQQRFDVLALDITLAINSIQAQVPARQYIIRKAEDTIFEILRGGLEIPVLVSKVVEETRALFNAGACALFLKEGDSLVQRPWAASGWLQRGPEERSYKLCSPELLSDNPGEDEKKGLTVWIAVKRQKFTARSNRQLKMHPHHRGTFDQYNFAGGGRCE